MFSMCLNSKKCLNHPIDDVISDVEQLQEGSLLSRTPRLKTIDQKDLVTCNKTLTFYKVQWSNHSEEKSTWEVEEFMNSNFPKFLSPQVRYAPNLSFTAFLCFL
jgi:hypothetical protein